jgi:hypothetical protein
MRCIPPTVVADLVFNDDIPEIICKVGNIVDDLFVLLRLFSS